LFACPKLDKQEIEFKQPFSKTVKGLKMTFEGTSVETLGFEICWRARKIWLGTCAIAGPTSRTESGIDLLEAGWDGAELQKPFSEFRKNVEEALTGP